eukprot:gnl/TRDRNA2_/TRDRNA2_198056_c0_seq1.p1 gnl/TRDRNA2_/TRDRNA2_198056_c0~~gnl/TRDRNA2_/TRDRNA2_198056_c0_seq1.p1  ORF type:complete len:178 (+),score=0.91 gnl/TRDRNA2_/TRDRNA2_198056_c0_seq1:215-748(+)
MWQLILYLYLVGTAHLLPCWYILMLLTCKLLRASWLPDAPDELQQIRRSITIAKSVLTGDVSRKRWPSERDGNTPRDVYRGDPRSLCGNLEHETYSTCYLAQPSPLGLCLSNRHSHWLHVLDRRRHQHASGGQAAEKFLVLELGKHTWHTEPEMERNRSLSSVELAIPRSICLTRQP